MNVTDNRSRVMQMSVAMLTAYACGSTLLGIVFVAMHQWHQPFRPAMIFPVIPVAWMAAYVARQWNCLIFGESRKPKLYMFFLPATGLYIAAALLAETWTSLTIVSVCVLFALSNALLVYTMEDENHYLENPNGNRCSRRFTIMVPLVFLVLQYILLGSNLVQAVKNPRSTVVACCVYCLYPYIWWYTLRRSRRNVLAINILLFLAIAGALTGYFLCYRSEMTGWMNYVFGFAPYTAMNAIAFAVFGGGVMAMPGLIELTQLHRAMVDDDENYNDRMRVFSVALILINVGAYCLWIWVPFSSVVLVGYTVGSCFWVILARYRYDKRNSNDKYTGTWVSVMAAPVLMTAFFFFECIGVWEAMDFTLSLSKKVPVFSIGVEGILVIVDAIVELLRERKNKKTNDMKRKRPLRLMECHAIGLIAAGVLTLAIVLLFENNRAFLAALAVSFNFIVILAAKWIMEHGSEVCN